MLYLNLLYTKHWPNLLKEPFSIIPIIALEKVPSFNKMQKKQNLTIVYLYP